jgi:hypothetical protein
LKRPLQRLLACSSTLLERREDMGVGNSTAAGVGLFVLARVGEAVVIMLLMYIFILKWVAKV